MPQNPAPTAQSPAPAPGAASSGTQESAALPQGPTPTVQATQQAAYAGVEAEAKIEAEAPFAEELPAGFWDSDAALPATASAPTAAPRTNPPNPAADPLPPAPELPAEAVAETFAAPPAAQRLDTDRARLEHDPTFATLQQLFPGHIASWEPSEAPRPAGAPEDDAADAPEAAEEEDEGD